MPKVAREWHYSIHELPMTTSRRAGIQRGAESLRQIKFSSFKGVRTRWLANYVRMCCRVECEL